MATEPGKYDDACTAARIMCGVTDETGGGVLLIVIGGKHGPGFSVQADAAVSRSIPALLEGMAQEIRKELEEMKL